MRRALLALVLVLTLTSFAAIFGAPLAAATATVITYEMPAPTLPGVPGVLGATFVQASTGPVPGAGAVDPDGSIDIGGATGVALASTHFVVTFADRSGSYVFGVVCQPQVGTSCAPSDPAFQICNGPQSISFARASPVNVYVPMPGSTLTQCPGSQAATVQGTITLSFQ